MKHASTFTSVEARACREPHSTRGAHHLSRRRALGRRRIRHAPGDRQCVLGGSYPT